MGSVILKLHLLNVSLKSLTCVNTALAPNSRVHDTREAGMLTYAQTKRRKEACIVDGDEG